jgi:hypothetical protein
MFLDELMERGAVCTVPTLSCVDDLPFIVVINVSELINIYMMNCWAFS